MSAPFGRKRRLCAALLLLGTIGINAVGPGLDALLYHRGVPQPLRTHIDRPGGCGLHAERCLLSDRQVAPRAPARGVAIALDRTEGPRPSPLPTAPLASRRPVSVHRSRAPPRALV